MGTLELGYYDDFKTTLDPSRFSNIPINQSDEATLPIECLFFARFYWRTV